MTTTLNATTSNGLVVTPDNSGNILLQYNGQSAPAFSAYNSSTQSIPNATLTKLTYSAEDFDTNSNFASSTFTPTVAGYYQINAGLFCAGAGSGGSVLSLYKNGALYVQLSRLLLSGSFNVMMSGSCLVYCNGSTDYLEIYTFQNSGGSLNMGSGDSTGFWFNGCLLRGA